MLNADYFKRIDALNFSMMSDDGQLPENLEHADIVLVGVSRTSKTPTSIYLANRGYKTANVPLVPHLPLPPALCLSSPSARCWTRRIGGPYCSDPAESLALAQHRCSDRLCRSCRGRRGDRRLATTFCGARLADNRRLASLDRRNGRGGAGPLSSPSHEVHCRRLSGMCCISRARPLGRRRSACPGLDEFDPTRFVGGGRTHAARSFLRILTNAQSKNVILQRAGRSTA